MRKRRSKEGVTVNAIAGTHVVTLGMDLDEARRAKCLGFAIQREDHIEDERYWMTGMKAFRETDPGLGPGGRASSREQPFQGFQWADYSAKPGYDYTYTVIPLYGKPAALEEGPRVAVRVATEPEVGGTHSVFFNRGSVASQEYARRYLDTRPNKLPEEAKAGAYAWLSRGLLEALLAFVARAGPDHGLRGAFYEFQWPDVLRALKAARARGVDVKVVYDGIHGSTKRKNEAAIEACGVKGLCRPRTTGKLMHNKFLVLTRRDKPVAVWTGSTNLTENGIFGHLNCGHIVEDEGVARQYLDYWEELATNPELDEEKRWMAEHNPNPPEQWSSDMTAVFSPHAGNDILDWYRDIAAGAEQALFMTFAFGMDGRFQDVYRREDDVLRIALMDKAGSGSGLAKGKRQIGAIRKRPNVLVAIGNRIATNSFDRWLAERGGLTSNVQWVHTKFMLVDPLSKRPTVVAGSANFSEPSTSTNNENMLVIRGDTRAADIYLGEYMRLYNHYAFRESVARSRQRGEKDWRPQYLDSDWKSWQRDYFAPDHDRSLRRVYFAQSG